MRSFKFNKRKISQIEIEGKVYEIDCGNLELIKSCAELETKLNRLKETGNPSEVFEIVKDFISAITGDYPRLYEISGGNLPGLLDLTKELAAFVTEEIASDV